MPIILTEFEERVLALNGLIHASRNLDENFRFPTWEEKQKVSAEIAASIGRHTHELLKLLRDVTHPDHGGELDEDLRQAVANSFLQLGKFPS